MANDDAHRWDWSNFEHYTEANPYSWKWAKMTWNDFLESSVAVSASFEKIIDMGCGPGDITETLIKWKDIKNEGKPEEIRDGAYKDKGSQYKEIVGTDISESAIAYCNEKRKKVLDDIFGDSVKMSYAVADSGDPTGVFWKKKDNMERFDLVTSFTAFHWIPDQKKALQCVASCLKPGGHFVIFLVLRNQFLQKSQHGLKSNSKWEPYIKDINTEDAVPWMRFEEKGLIPSNWEPSHIADAYRKLASEVGLQVKCKSIIDKIFHDDINLRMIVSASTPLLKAVPEDMKKDLLDDILNEMKRLNPPVLHEGKMCVVSEFECLLVCGVKKM